MPSFAFHTVDVFTTQRYAGNPLAIVTLPTEDALATEQMQTITKEFNLSETVFITPTSSREKSVPGFRLRIFMTHSELPFAGHPTIGAACYALGTLAQGVEKGRLVCNAGPIDTEFRDGVARASIPQNFHHHTEHSFGTEGVYGLQPSFQASGVSIEGADVVSPVKGMNFVAVRLASLRDLEKVAVNGIAPKARLDEDWDVGFTGSYFYVVTSAPGDEVLKVRTRMVEGTIEDPATGSAACGLSCFLALQRQQQQSGGRKVQRVEITQGVEMGRRSEIGVEVTVSDDGKGVERVELSGSSVGVMQGRLEV